MLESKDVIKLLEDNTGYEEILQRAVEVEERLQEEAFLFNWEDIYRPLEYSQEIPSEVRLKEFLYQQFYLEWIKESIITKYDSHIIYVHNHEDIIAIKLNDPTLNSATASINKDNGKTYQFDVKHPHADKILVYKSNQVKWEWDDVRAAPASIKKMVIAGIIDKVHRTNKYTEYALVDRDIVKAALEQIEYDQDISEFEANQPTVQDQSPMEVPENIFDIIVGYDDIKTIIQTGLGKDKPVNTLFIGPPGTAKSMFLEEINRIPGSSYHLGSSSTKAGLAEFLFNQEPRIILIDEFEKMDKRDFAVLLSLMEGGKIVETKKGRRKEITINTSVFASCNSIKNIPVENLSRFHFKFKFIPYTETEFEEIVQRILTTREQVVPALARYIATATSKTTKDVREAVGISRVCDSHEDVDNIMKTREKYQG